LLFIEHTTV